MGVPIPCALLAHQQSIRRASSLATVAAGAAGLRICAHTTKWLGTIICVILLNTDAFMLTDISGCLAAWAELCARVRYELYSEYTQQLRRNERMPREAERYRCFSGTSRPVSTGYNPTRREALIASRNAIPIGNTPPRVSVPGRFRGGQTMSRARGFVDGGDSVP